MNDLYKCVLKLNTRPCKLKSVNWTVVPGPHWIEDHTKSPPEAKAVRVIPTGTKVIECFRMDKIGRWRVYETHLPGGIVVKGKLKKGFVAARAGIEPATK